MNRACNLPPATCLTIAMLFFLPGNRLMGQNCDNSSVGFPPLADLTRDPQSLSSISRGSRATGCIR
jgi:hypothetical protein